MPRWPGDLVAGFDAGLAVGMIALFWRWVCRASNKFAKLRGVLRAFWSACAPQAWPKLCVHLRVCVYFQTCTKVLVGGGCHCALFFTLVERAPARPPATPALAARPLRFPPRPHLRRRPAPPSPPPPPPAVDKSKVLSGDASAASTDAGDGRGVGIAAGGASFPPFLPLALRLRRALEVRRAASAAATAAGLRVDGAAVM